MTNRKNNRKERYLKPIISVSNQKTLLIWRWLSAVEWEQVDWYLRNVGYYRLSIYRKALEEDKDKFKNWTTFKNITDLYEFDKKLRLLILPYLEVLENSLKTAMIREIWENIWGFDWSFRHHDSRCFKDPLKGLSTIRWICQKNKDHICMKHYYDAYYYPKDPPIRMVMQVASFWEISRIFSSLKAKHQKQVSKVFWIHHSYLVNRLYCLLQLRNKAAHYDRIWNRKFTWSLRVDHRDYEFLFNNIHQEYRQQSLYSYLLVLIILWKNIESTFETIEIRIWQLLTEYDSVNISKMWFPENWQQVLQEVLSV